MLEISSGQLQAPSGAWAYASTIRSCARSVSQCVYRPRNIFPTVSLCHFAVPVIFFVLQSGTLYEAICDGCPVECEGCSFEEPQLVLKCSDPLEHSISPGGTITLDALVIEPGYWRATPSSENVLECYNADACLGGVTGSESYCLEGYERPCEFFLPFELCAYVQGSLEACLNGFSRGT